MRSYLRVLCLPGTSLPEKSQYDDYSWVSTSWVMFDYMKEAGQKPPFSIK